MIEDVSFIDALRGFGSDLPNGPFTSQLKGLCISYSVAMETRFCFVLFQLTASNRHR